MNSKKLDSVRLLLLVGKPVFSSQEINKAIDNLSDGEVIQFPEDQNRKIRYQAFNALRTRMVILWNLPEILKIFDSFSEWPWITAIQALGERQKLGEELKGSRDILLRCLQYPENWRIRYEAIVVLGGSKNQDSIPESSLITAISDESQLIRSEAQKILTEQMKGWDPTRIYQAAACHEITGVRETALKALELVMSKWDTDELVRFIYNQITSPKIRRIAISVIGQQGRKGSEVNEALLQAATDKDEAVRESAGEALLARLSEYDTNTLATIITSKGHDYLLRINIIHALKEQEEPRVDEALIKVITVDNKGSRVKETAVAVLQERIKSWSNTALIKTASHQGLKVREMVVSTLQQRKGTEIDEALIKAATDEDEVVREIATKALRNRNLINTLRKRILIKELREVYVN